MFEPIYRRLNSRFLRSKRKRMEASFEYFQELTKLEGVESVVFERGLSTLGLSDGRKFWFDPLSGTASGLFSLPVSGEFERKETDMVRRLVSDGDICIDVGANFGYYSVLMSLKAGSSGAVHAFEPLNHTYSILLDNLNLNKCSNVVPNEYALDKTAGEKEIFLPDIGISGSFKLHRYKKSFKKFTINAISLDQYVSEKDLKCVDFLKADVEGAELLMLEGALKVLEESRPILFLEVQESSTLLFDYQPEDIFKLLDALSYKVFYVENDSLIPVNDLKNLPDYNFFFIPAAKIDEVKQHVSIGH